MLDINQLNEEELRKYLEKVLETIEYEQEQTRRRVAAQGNDVLMNQLNELYGEVNDYVHNEALATAIREASPEYKSAGAQFK